MDYAMHSLLHNRLTLNGAISLKIRFKRKNLTKNSTWTVGNGYKLVL